MPEIYVWPKNSLLMYLLGSRNSEGGAKNTDHQY